MQNNNEKNDMWPASLAAAISFVILVYVFHIILVGIRQGVDDEYCKSVPMERMDKKRCGVEHDDTDKHNPRVKIEE